MDVGVDAQPGEALHVAQVVEDGEHYDPGIGGGISHPPEDLLGHIEVHVYLRYEHVGALLPQEGQGPFSRIRVTDHLYALAREEDGKEALAEHGVVV